MVVVAAVAIAVVIVVVVAAVAISLLQSTRSWLDWVTCRTLIVSYNGEGNGPLRRM